MGVRRDVPSVRVTPKVKTGLRKIQPPVLYCGRNIDGASSLEEELIHQQQHTVDLDMSDACIRKTWPWGLGRVLTTRLSPRAGCVDMHS